MLSFDPYDKVQRCYIQRIEKKTIYFLRVYIKAELHDTILSHATSSRQAYDMIYDCRSVLKHVLKCYDIISDVHNNRKSCRGLVVSRCRMRQSRTVLSGPKTLHERT